VGGAEIVHVVTLAIPTVGFPTTIAAFTWVGDVLSGRTQWPRP
jgi:alkylhydroperoxidase/carboxymuconolactone decarboxylase family protein YurZ